MTLLFVFLSWIGSYSAELSNEAKRLVKESEQTIGLRDYELLKTKGESLIKTGTADANPEEKTLGEAYRLLALICMRDTSNFTNAIESLREEAVKLKTSNPQAYGVINRTLSTYYIKILSDFSNALNYATEYLNVSRAEGRKVDESYALSQIANIYYLKRDESGWSYALEAYEKSKGLDDIGPKYVAACNLASYLFNKKDYKQAMEYLQEAITIADNAKMDSEDSFLNSFLGDIYYKLGDHKKAVQYYIMSIDDSPSSSSYDITYSGICYAQYLFETGRLDDALAQLAKTVEYASKNKITIFDDYINHLYSEIYETKGDFKKALEYHKKYTSLTLNLYSEQKEREFAVLDLRNKVMEEENKNNMQSLELMRKGRTIIILFAFAAIILILFIGIIFYNRRKLREYREATNRYLENAKVVQRLEHKLEEAQSDKFDDQKSGCCKKIEKSDQIYRDLERLMKEEKIYRDNSLSLEKAAALLATNRTYLSQIVNDIGGKSFSSYVNDYRLNEAVELLSDPSNTDSLKSIGLTVGFSSPSNFYTLFRQKVGVSPSVFRTNLRNM